MTSCFGLALDESVQCGRCGKETHKHSHTCFSQVSWQRI